MGVLRQRCCHFEAATDAIAVDPHPTLPLQYKGRGKRLLRIELPSPGDSGTLVGALPENGDNTTRANLVRWSRRWLWRGPAGQAETNEGNANYPAAARRRTEDA